MDSLRHWVMEMHVDGFRFDLAPVLARELYEVNRLGTFFDIIQQDPVLSQVKLIAEPWDVGPGGYQVGNFPVGWAEWNGKYRDCVRRFWRGDPGQLPELAFRLSGSSDLYEASGRNTYASVNFVTAHDGFTLQDLVTYEEKHNEANGEGNDDGSDENFSSNWGVEGPSDQPEVVKLRERMKRNLMATLVFSQGVRMVARRRRDRADAAREQQRVRPGRRDQLVRLGAPRQGDAALHAVGPRRSSGPTRCSVAARSSAARSTAADART